MAAGLCIFEDRPENFSPLSDSRPVYDLRFGAVTLREKIVRLFLEKSGKPENSPILFLFTREYLAEYLKEENPRAAVNRLIDGPIVFINGRVLLDGKSARAILSAKKDTLFYSGSFLAAATAGPATVARLRKLLSGAKKSLAGKIIPVGQKIPTGQKTPAGRQSPAIRLTKILSSLIKNKKNLKVEKLDYIWDLISKNGAEIKNDFGRFFRTGSGRVPAGVKILNRSQVAVGKNVKINHLVVLDGRKGPVIIEDEAQIGAFSVIEGPVFIGRGAMIKPNSYIYDGTSIGPFSKVAGEIEATIIQGFSNKQHDGFLGHSFLGEWVNLGAGTTTSDLKNNYGEVKIFQNGQKIATGTKFLGALIGDHAKSAINTSFTTGTVCGVMANVFEAPAPKTIPAFAWGGRTGKKFQLEKALLLAAAVMRRRGRTCSPAYQKILSHLFN